MDIATELRKIASSLSRLASGEELKKKMIKHLEKQFAGMLDPQETEANEFDMEAAIYWFASDHHGGQGSDLYSILSTSDFRPGPTHRSVKDEGDTAEMMYDELVSEFA